jgi:hypothetical protein
MRRLNGFACAVSVVLSIVVPARRAAAETPHVEPACAVPLSTTTAPRLGPWELGPVLGYARAWTNGLSHLEVTTGLSLDYELPSHLAIGGSLLHHFGSHEAGAGPGTRYHASVASSSADLRVGYSFWFADRLVVRPGLSGGLTWVTGSTEVGGLPRSNDSMIGTVGPSLTLLVRVERYLLGLESDARFVPSQVAGPIGAIYGVFRVRL